MIQSGRADVVVAGGAEASICAVTVAGFAQARTLSTRNDAPERASRPFDVDRDGFVLGEGAGVLVLERDGAARARGRTPYARLAGAGVTSDAYDIVQPDQAGQIRALRAAVTRSGLGYDDIVHVNAHATSTPIGDMGEADALAGLFGEDTVVTSTKSMTGHLLGAAGAVEAIATVLAIQHGTIPPTINLDDPDDELRVDVPREVRTMPVPAAISDSFGFGGHNTSVVFTRT
jgi:3-oxoacyl-[acyl-carrier-protein] synthase II